MARQRRLDPNEEDAFATIQPIAESYTKLLRQRMKTQAKENESRDELLEVMREHKIDLVELSDGTEVSREQGKDRIKVKSASDDE